MEESLACFGEEVNGRDDGVRMYGSMFLLAQKIYIWQVDPRVRLGQYNKE